MIDDLSPYVPGTNHHVIIIASLFGKLFPNRCPAVADLMGLSFRFAALREIAKAAGSGVTCVYHLDGAGGHGTCKASFLAWRPVEFLLKRFPAINVIVLKRGFLAGELGQMLRETGLEHE